MVAQRLHAQSARRQAPFVQVNCAALPESLADSELFGHKKGAFLQQAVIELALPNAEAVIARVEDYAPPAPFDIVISRAFSDLATFAQSSARHLAPGGRLVAMKGVFPDEEIALVPPAFRVVASPALAVPGLDAERHLIVMERA